MLVGGIAKNEKMASVIACLLYFPMLIFSGATLPFEVMSGMMQKIVALFPLAAYSEMAVRWGISKATTGRILKKLADMDYISLMSFPGRTGSVIYLHSYLSTMFQISDVLVDKEEVAMVLKINLALPDETDSQEDSTVTEHEICVSEELTSVSKSNMETVITKMAQVLDAQGISCFRCPKSIYKLYPLSDACREEYISHILKGAVRFGMTVSCGEDKPVHRMRLFLTEAGYKKALENQDRSFIQILNHARVSQGHLRYDRLDGER